MPAYRARHAWVRRTAACLAFGLCAAAAGQTFVFGKQFRVGPNPRDVVAADLNEDGWPEIVTADSGILADRREERPANDELSLLIAQGNLDYVRHSPSLKTGFAPYRIAIANIDALRMPDIVVVSFLAVRNRDLLLYRNLPDGLFESVQFRVPDESLDYTRHVDGDGLPVFTRPGLTSLAIHDVDKDGYRDVIATGWSSDVLVHFPGSPTEYFGAPRFIPAAGGPRDIQIADFDQDGHADLAVSLYASGEIGLWRGSAGGAFEPVTRFLSRGRLPAALRVADVNGDGRKDLVVAHTHSDDSIVIFYGDGGFNFSVSQEIMLGSDRGTLECEIRGLVVEDLTGNGRVDIAAACFTGARVEVLVNVSEDAARPQRFKREHYTFKEGRPRALCTADFNRDGKTDLAVAQWEPDAVQLMLGR